MDSNWRNDNIFEDLYNTSKEKKRDEYRQEMNKEIARRIEAMKAKSQ